MKPIDFNKYKFRMRSLPNSRTIKKYLDGYLWFLGAYIAYNFVTICLFRDELTPTLPTPFVFAVPIIFIHVYSTIEAEYLQCDRDSIKSIIVHIRLKQTQSLIEKLETNPEMLKATYNKKSLLYWARHYQNLEANTIITKMMFRTH